MLVLLIVNTSLGQLTLMAFLFSKRAGERLMRIVVYTVIWFEFMLKAAKVLVKSYL